MTPEECKDIEINDIISTGCVTIIVDHIIRYNPYFLCEGRILTKKLKLFKRGDTTLLHQCEALHIVKKNYENTNIRREI